MIRRASAEDAAAIGEVFVAARDQMTYLPRIPEEDRQHLGEWLFERHELWVDEEDKAVVGFVAFSETMLDHIYIRPDMQGRGVGLRLLNTAKANRPRGLELWVFQKNAGARRFYERHGFRLVELTDGTRNMELEPDARYEWRP
jgi:GNAT superfamily N-acetyltransferase